ncbi:uncharacterized protein LOC143296093 isoform X2 [Babylonia areolata]|uniref:uncharacterized protein LOC143296093 isoform X2 n=1 Tax=Babylonia areolata TaxID=304850 RepID=UPI003FD1AE08
MNTPHTHPHSLQISTDNSQQQSSEADVKSGDCAVDKSPGEPVFYLELDDRDTSSLSGDDASAQSSKTKVSNRSNFNIGNDCGRHKNTAQWTFDEAASFSLGSNFDNQQARHGDNMTGANAHGPSNEHAVTSAQASQGCLKTPPRSAVPVVERANSSPLSTVCRQTHCNTMIVRCQVNSHDLPVMQLSSSCPAAFSPRWTRVVTPQEPRSSRRRRKRRHTVASAMHMAADQRHLHCDTDHSLQHDVSVFQQGGAERRRERSMSDSELQHLLMREVGRELRKMSDDFHFLKTGERLTTVTESESEDSDDDI